MVKANRGFFLLRKKDAEIIAMQLERNPAKNGKNCDRTREHYLGGAISRLALSFFGNGLGSNAGKEPT